MQRHGVAAIGNASRNLRSSGHFEGEHVGTSYVPIVKIPLERMGTAFPLLSYGENAYILLKMHFAVQKDVFLTLKYGKTRWRPELRPGPCWGSLRRSPDPLDGWGGDSPPQTSPRSAPSILAPSALNFGVSVVVNLRNDHCLGGLER